MAKALCVSALAACSSGTDIPQSLPYQENIPADAAFIYQFDPTLLYYDFVDSTTTGGVHLRWLFPLDTAAEPDTLTFPFSGYTCFAFSPRTPTDTIGDFVFIARGVNTGYLERNLLTEPYTDTLVASFLSGREGSRGRYVLHPNGDLQLNWLNGEQVRYFDPTATLRVTGDTLSSSVTLRAAADSVVVTWRVGWIAAGC